MFILLLWFHWMTTISKYKSSNISHSNEWQQYRNTIVCQQTKPLFVVNNSVLISLFLFSFVHSVSFFLFFLFFFFKWRTTPYSWNFSLAFNRVEEVGTLGYGSEDGNFNFAMVAGEIRGNRWFRQCPRNGGESREN